MAVSTYSGNSSNDLTECKGELGSFLVLTSLLLNTFIKKEASARSVALVSSVEETQCMGFSAKSRHFESSRVTSPLVLKSGQLIAKLDLRNLL